MQLARVIGKVTATIKHPTFTGWRLVILQPLLADGSADGEPQVGIDHLGSALGSTVIAAADGSAAKEIMKVKDTPARWVVVGLPDPNSEHTSHI